MKMIMMITTRVAEIVDAERVCVQTGVIMIMMILTMQKEAPAIGKDREEIKAGAMDMKRMMTTDLIQEGALVAIQATAVVGGWEMKVQTGALAVKKGATAVQDQVADLIIVTETIVTVHQAEVKVKVQVGALEVIRAATAILVQVIHLIMATETKIAVHQAEEEMKVQTGALAVIKAATGVVIQMNRTIWEEAVVNHAVLKMKEEEEAETVPGQAGAVHQDHLQTEEAVAAAIGDVFIVS